MEFVNRTLDMNNEEFKRCAMATRTLYYLAILQDKKGENREFVFTCIDWTEQELVSMTKEYAKSKKMKLKILLAVLPIFRSYITDCLYPEKITPETREYLEIAMNQLP